MKYIIKRYQPHYFSGLKKLIDSTYGTDIYQEKIEANYTEGNRQIILAIDEYDNVIGCAFLEERIDYVRADHSLFITYVAVDPSLRMQGIGKSLFKKIELIAKENSCSEIELTSANYRKEAHRFYNAIGFSVKKTTVFIKEINTIEYF